MKKLNRLLALLLALLIALPLTGFAAEKQTPIEKLGARLLEAQAALDRAEDILTGTEEDVARLEAKYEKNPGSSKKQDQLIDAMIAQEAAAEAYAQALDDLMHLQDEQARMAEDAECEDLVVEYEGRYANLLVTATVDENMVLYGLTAEVDGSDRDQLVGENSYLYRFIGKDIPLTIGEKKTDDVAPLSLTSPASTPA